MGKVKKMTFWINIVRKSRVKRKEKEINEVEVLTRKDALDGAAGADDRDKHGVGCKERLLRTAI